MLLLTSNVMRAPNAPPQLPRLGGFLVPKRVLCTWASLPEHDQACVLKSSYPGFSWVLQSCPVQWALKHQPSQVPSCFPRAPKLCERTLQLEGVGAQAGVGDPCPPQAGFRAKEVGGAGWGLAQIF